MTHDYEAARKQLVKTNHNYREGGADVGVASGYVFLLTEDEIAAILSALKLAAKVTGEPSVTMLASAYQRPQKNKPTEYGEMYGDIFKAMVQQAQREI